MEIYILPSGEEVDLTGYPENQIVMWLSNNPGATKKAGGNAAGANATPQNNMFAPQEDTELVSETISLDSPTGSQEDLYGLPENITQQSSNIRGALQNQFGKYNEKDLLGMYNDMKETLQHNINVIENYDIKTNLYDRIF